MIFQRENIMRDVRVCIDQNMSGSTLIGMDDVDTLSLNDIIESKIEEGVRAVELSAPLPMLDTGTNFGASLFWNSDHSGWTLLPDDFGRFIVFQMSDWERPVYECIDARDPKYQHQFSRLQGIKGSPERPVCAIVPRAEGLALEFYSCKNDTATVTKAVYKKLPILEHPKDGSGAPITTTDKGIDISKRCYRAAIDQIAALVLYTYNETQLAEKMEQLAAKQLN